MHASYCALGLWFMLVWRAGAHMVAYHQVLLPCKSCHSFGCHAVHQGAEALLRRAWPAFVAPFACSQRSQPHPLTTSPST